MNKRINDKGRGFAASFALSGLSDFDCVLGRDPADLARVSDQEPHGAVLITLDRGALDGLALGYGEQRLAIDGRLVTHVNIAGGLYGADVLGIVVEIHGRGPAGGLAVRRGHLVPGHAALVGLPGVSVINDLVARVDHVKDLVFQARALTQVAVAGGGQDVVA